VEDYPVGLKRLVWTYEPFKMRREKHHNPRIVIWVSYWKNGIVKFFFKLLKMMPIFMHERAWIKDYSRNLRKIYIKMTQLSKRTTPEKLGIRVGIVLYFPVCLVDFFCKKMKLSPSTSHTISYNGTNSLFHTIQWHSFVQYTTIHAWYLVDIHAYFVSCISLCVDSWRIP